MHPYSVFKKLWEWQVTCSLCGYKSRWYGSSKIAHARAIIHAVHRHIFGHTTIAAREAKRGGRQC